VAQTARFPMIAQRAFLVALPEKQVQFILN
jgi:hypothetical protein